MKLKKICCVGLMSLMSVGMLAGCGNDTKNSSSSESSHQQEEKVEQSSSSESSETGQRGIIEALKDPFAKGYPFYVFDLDDQNRIVEATMEYYSKDKVRVKEFDEGDLEHTYLVDYQVKELQKDEKGKLAMYRYSFYDEPKGEWYHYDACPITLDDIPNQSFVFLSPMIDNNKDYSAKQMKKLSSDGDGTILCDDFNIVSMK